MNNHYKSLPRLYSFHFGYPKPEVITMRPRRKRPINGIVDKPLPDVGQIPNIDFARDPIEKDLFDVDLEDL